MGDIDVGRCGKPKPGDPRRQCVLVLKGTPTAAHRIHRDINGETWEEPSLGVEFGGDAELEVSGYTPQNLTALSRLLSTYRCCGAPQLCGARCQDDPLSSALATACREVEEALAKGVSDPPSAELTTELREDRGF